MKFYNHKKITATSFSQKAGFTLVEMLVAVFVFSVVMVLSTGAIFSIVSANKTSQAVKSVMDNLNSALDSMSREIRYGTVYNCGFTYSDFSTPNSCPTVSSQIFAFVARPTTLFTSGEHVIYRFVVDHPADNSGHIDRCSYDLNHCISLTATEVHVTDLHFYVQGSDRTTIGAGQPELLIIISGYAQAGTSQSKFNIETMVDQRNLDMCKYDIPVILRPSGGC